MSPNFADDVMKISTSHSLKTDYEFSILLDGHAAKAVFEIVFAGHSCHYA